MRKYSLFTLLLLLQWGVGRAQTLEWHIKDAYVDVQYLGNQLFKVKTNTGKWGIVNEYGALSVEARYDSISSLVDNRALLLDATGQYLKGIVNEKGQLIKTFNNNERIANYPYFKEGMLAYGVIAGNYYLFGYLDTQGNTCVEPKYYWAAPFSDGKAVVQYKSRNFGLINRFGDPMIKDNRKFKFMSSLVDNKLLFVFSSSRGDKVVSAKLDAKGELTGESDLESGTIVRCSNDYRSISCQNGHIYFFDEAMRAIYSSTGLRLNLPEQIGAQSVSHPSVFRKIKMGDGWKIMYEGKELLQSTFKQISFCDNDFVLVASQRRCGVLKLNPNGVVRVEVPSQQVEFAHNSKVSCTLPVFIEGLLPSTQVQLGVVAPNGEEERLVVPQGYTGTYDLNYTFFVPYYSANSQARTATTIEQPIIVHIYLDGVLYRTETATLTAVHKRGFVISDPTSPRYSNANGAATIHCAVRSLHGAPSASARVSVSGTNIQNRSFNGREVLSLDIPVTVPYESTKTYSFVVTVKEDGCIPISRTIECTISHYNLQ